MAEVFHQTLGVDAITYPQPCYYCGEDIKTVEDAAYLPVFLNRIVNGKSKKTPMLRVCHCDCQSEIKRAMQENHDEDVAYRNKCYDKFRIWLNQPTGNLPLHFIIRLDGMRQGRKFSKGQNVHYLGRGYSFELIYTTMIYASHEIDHMIRSSEFKDVTHRINAIFVVLFKHIDNVKQKMKKKQRENDRLDKLIEQMQQDAEGREEIEFNAEWLRAKNSKAKQDFINSFKEDEEEDELDFLEE